jgi:hypothetical protein
MNRPAFVFTRHRMSPSQCIRELMVPRVAVARIWPFQPDYNYLRMAENMAKTWLAAPHNPDFLQVYIRSQCEAMAG